jgi:drug/metabolite transporter (DMT)-like permease
LTTHQTTSATAAAPQRTGGRGYAIALSSVLVWSWTGVLVAHLLRSQPIAPMTLAFWRDLGSAATLLLVLAGFRRGSMRIARRDWGFLLLYGASVALLNASWTWSTAYNGAAVSVVLAYSSPAFTALAARAFFGERLGPARMVALVASLAGCVLVSGANDPARWNLNGPGIVAGVLSAVSFALFSMMGKAASRRGIDPWTATLYTFAVAALAILPLALLTPGAGGAGGSLLSLGSRWDGWLLLLLLVVPTLGGYGLYTASLAYLPAATANIVATLEPVLTTLWAWLLLGESLDLAQSVGAALIVGSVVGMQLEGRGGEEEAVGAQVTAPPAQT